MAVFKPGVTGTPDPNFKPDPNEMHVWDPVKNVYRKVTKRPKKAKLKKVVDNGTR